MLERLADDVRRNTALEPYAEGYVHPPYAFAPRPDALAAQLYGSDLMERHLEVLAEKQQTDGG